jgi:hypothetical protein
VVELNQSCLPVGVRDRRCSATTTLYPGCSKSDVVPHLCRCRTRGPWRFHFFAHLHEHLEDNHTSSCTIVKGSRAGLPPAQRMILKALIILLKWATFESTKTLQQHHLYRSQRKSSKYYTGEQWTKQLISYFWMQSHTLGKLGVQLRTPGKDRTGNPSTRSRQAAQQ